MEMLQKGEKEGKLKGMFPSSHDPYLERNHCLFPYKYIF
jgi:hypothetical protein